MLTANYNYQETLAASAKANWRIEDIIGGDKRLDFTKPFMPESLARVESLDFLSKEEKVLLNQIRGYGYLYTFGVVEEFILPFVLDHARPHLNEDDYRTRALLQFASEEAKHIHLFKKFAEEFKAGFVTYCETIGPPEEIGKAVLSHSPLGVALVILGNRVDDAKALSRKRSRRRRSRPAIQELAASSLDGGSATHQAGHTDGPGHDRQPQCHGDRKRF